jgi:galactokinase
MTGGGFGGCTINLVSPDAAGLFKEKVAREYNGRAGAPLVTYFVQPSGGARSIHDINAFAG